MTDPKRQSGEQPEALLEAQRSIAADERDLGNTNSGDVLDAVANAFEALQERCGGLEGALRQAEPALARLISTTPEPPDEALEALRTIRNVMPQLRGNLPGALAPGGDGGEGQSVEERQGRSFHPKCPCVFHVVGQTIAPECPVHGQPHPTEPDRPEGECPHEFLGSSKGDSCMLCLRPKGHSIHIHGTPQGKESE